MDISMKHIKYDRRNAIELLPLLAAIGREIQDRNKALQRLEAEIARLEKSKSTSTLTGRLHGLIAEIATHRKGLRVAKVELERLGCSVVGTEPLTFRIPGRVGEANHSFVWQTGNPVLQ